MTNFQLEEFVSRGNELLAETKKIFAENKDFINASLPESMQPEDGTIKLVFVGQFTAGKSSIIKMLTGLDVKTGAGITTQNSAPYNWNGLDIIDTPGIHTGLREDHDEITYNEIDHAALLIFVVTNEGFDDKIGKHFRKLAIEQGRGKNMVLVVNKMDRTKLGNVPEQQKIIANDFVEKKVITPFTPEDLFLSFLNTEYYFEWQKETDPELKEIYLRESGYEEFVKNLNAFVASRGVLSKVQTPLETLKSSITKVIGQSSEKTFSKNLEEDLEDQKNKRKILIDGMNRTKFEIKELARACENKIRAEGSEVAREIKAGVTEEQFKREVERAQVQVELYIDSCQRDIVDCISENCKNIDREISLIDSSAMAREIKYKKINIPVNLPSSDKDFGLKAGMAGMTPSMINMTAKEASKQALKIPQIGNIKFADMVKKAGHFFGKKFIPWESVNFVKNTAKVLGWIGAAITIYQFLDKVLGKDKEKEMNDKIQDSQTEMRNNFDEVGKKVYTEITSSAIDELDRLTAPIMEDVNDKIAEFEKNKTRLANLGNGLQKILKDLEILMGDVQQTAKS